MLAFYGVTVKHNKALCPIHNEKSPSFTVYTKRNSWFCFGCGNGGSVIDFVMAFFGVNALEAAKKLDTDYNLGLFECIPSEEEINRLSEQRAVKQAYRGLAETFEAYMQKSFNILCDYFRLLNEWKVIYAPQSIEDVDTVNLLFVEACHQLDYIEYLIDYLTTSDYEEQIQFYQLHRKEMAHIARKVKRYSESRNTNESA